MKKTIFGMMVLALVLITAACGGTDSGSDEEESSGDADGVEEMKLKFSHVVSENTPKHQGALAMKEYIESESDGKITLEVYPSGSLFGDQEEYQNLVSNNVQFIAPDVSKFSGHNPQFNVPSLPFAFDADENAYAFWDGEEGQDILGSLTDDGVLGLYMWPNGGKHITNDVKPISAPEDFEGLSFRTQGGGVLESIYDILGASSETIPFSELYTALDQGVVDGEENTFSNIESKKFDEVQDYMTVLNHSRVDYAIFTNQEFWEGMNDATKEIVEAGVQEGTDVAREEAQNLNAAAFETLKERGDTEITELTEEEVNAFREVLEPVYDEFEDEIGADVYEAILKANE